MVRGDSLPGHQNGQPPAKTEFRLGGICAEGLFIPGESVDPLATDRLLSTVWRLREATLLALAMKVLYAEPEVASEIELEATMETYKALSQRRRRLLMEASPFRVLSWHLCRLLTGPVEKASGQRAILRQRLEDLRRLVVSASTNPAGSKQGLPYQICGHEVDPLIREAASPMYVFDDPARERPGASVSAEGIRVFSQVVNRALARIECVWPAMTADFPRFVNTIVYLPDAKFRSCSAPRYAGAILLSHTASGLLSLEEDLIHELAHEILYNVEELETLICDDRRTFTLPWLGTQRDAYVYFQATYVYLVLALYFERAMGRNSQEDEAVEARLTAILAGLEKALPDFANADFLTPTGQHFFDRLADHASRMIQRR